MHVQNIPNVSNSNDFSMKTFKLSYPFNFFSFYKAHFLSCSSSTYLLLISFLTFHFGKVKEYTKVNTTYIHLMYPPPIYSSYHYAILVSFISPPTFHVPLSYCQFFEVNLTYFKFMSVSCTILTIKCIH